MRRIPLNYALFAVVYFLEGMLALAGIAMPLFMKDELGLSVGSVAALFGFMSLPWILKPIYGLASDFLPIMGYRRKPYLMIGSVLCFAGWGLTAGWATTVTRLVTAQFIADVGIASIDVFTDGLAVEQSTNKNRGLIQTICWGSRSLGAIIAGVSGGWLLTFLSYTDVFWLTSILPLGALVIAFFIKEKPHKHIPSLSTITHLGQKYLKSTSLQFTALFFFVWYATPSFGTPFFFYMRETLGFDEASLGLLASMYAIGMLIGTLSYRKYFDHYPITTLLRYLVYVSFITPLMYVFITSQPIAMGVYVINGVIGGVGIVHIMKLAAKQCPTGGEATTFSVLTSIVNFGGGVLGPIMGGLLFSFVGLWWLIGIAAGANILALLVLPRIKV